MMKSKGVKGEGERRREKKKMRKEKDGGSRGKDRPMLTMKRRRDGDDGDPEMEELWDTIAGGDSEDDKEGVRTVDDDNFIDDSGLDPADRYGGDSEAGSPSCYAQGRPAINKLKKLSLLNEALSNFSQSFSTMEC